MSSIRTKQSPEVINAALASIREKRLSIRKASNEFGIPLATLHDKLTGKRPVIAYAQTLLTPEEEVKLAKWLIELAKRGFGKTGDEVRQIAKQILNTRNCTSKSKTEMPTSSWLYNFFKRHPELTLRTPQSLGKERALVTIKAIEKWFNDLKWCVDSIDPSLLSDPTRIYNADETGFSFDAKSRKVIACRGSKHVYNVTAGVKSQVTVLACASASGHFLSPLLIYPYKRIPSKNLLDHFPEAFLQVSDNGWITAQIFYSWLRDSFIPATAHVQKPVVLLVDGHSSHTALVETSQLCHDNHIVLYCLLPHASHLIQPLDQAFFGAIKPAWSDAIRHHISEHGEGVNLESFAKVLKPVWLKATTPSIAAQSFKAAGILPYDPYRILQSPKLGPSAVFGSTPLGIHNVAQPTNSNKVPTKVDPFIKNHLHTINDNKLIESQPISNDTQAIIEAQHIESDTVATTETQRIESYTVTITETQPIEIYTEAIIETQPIESYTQALIETKPIVNETQVITQTIIQENSPFENENKSIIDKSSLPESLPALSPPPKSNLSAAQLKALHDYSKNFDMVKWVATNLIKKFVNLQ